MHKTVNNSSLPVSAYIRAVWPSSNIHCQEHKDKNHSTVQLLNWQLRCHSLYTASLNVLKLLKISSEPSITFTSTMDSQIVETEAALCAVQRKMFELPTFFIKILIYSILVFKIQLFLYQILYRFLASYVTFV
jgi:hypothetical protein